MTEYIYDEAGFPVFKIKYITKNYKDVSAKYEVSEITSWTADSEKNPLDIEPYLKVDIRYDSCSHIWFGGEDGDNYFHFCGIESFKRHIRLLKWLYEDAFKKMNRVPLEGDSIEELKWYV